MTKYVNILFIYLVSSLTISGQDVLTLESAIQTALENNYQIKIARNNETISQNSNTSGNAGFLPRLNTNAAYNYTNNNSQLEFFSGDEQKRNGASSNAIRAGATISWTAFDGFKMFAVKDRLEILEQQSRKLTEKEMHDLVTQIQQAYLLVIRLQQQQAIIKESIALDQETLTLAQDKLRLGAGTQLEVLQTTNRLNTDSSTYLNNQDQIVKSQITLNQLMNVEPERRYSVETTWNPNLLPSIDELSSLAIAQNYDLQLLEYEEQIALTQIKEARSILYPTLDFNLGYTYNFSKAEAGFLLSNQTYGPSFGVTLNYDLFQGRLLNREIENAEILKDNIALNQQNTEATIRSQMAEIYQDYLALIEIQALEARNVSIAEQNVQLASDLYRLGRTTDFAVREAILAVQQVKDRLSDVEYRQKLAEIQLKSLAGIPLF